MKHGELTSDRAGRWCKVHKGEHGFLYPCEHYDKIVLNEVKRLGIKFKHDCENGLITFNVIERKK